MNSSNNQNNQNSNINTLPFTQNRFISIPSSNYYFYSPPMYFQPILPSNHFISNPYQIIPTNPHIF